MTPAAIIKEAMADGVNLSLTPSGTIKAIGEAVAVNRWLPLLREHKPEILAVLAHEPGLKGSGWRPWKPESAADIAEAVKEAEDERAAIMEFDGCLPRAEVQAKAYAWHWKSDRHDPVTGSYGGTYICPHADPETVRHELEARFGGRVTELHRWDRAPRGAAGRV